MRSLCDKLDAGRESGAPLTGSDIVLFERAHAILAEALDAVEDV
ncbi:hypothetical protein GCM10011410_12400 [Hoyosella rhizosphaerae]|uniref:Uncharacterized protein n=2 Tax=Hoyosella rhizosphaerae TaxID=1755582 RepID=A0A916U5J0_9ACTN|nr:hypothetical protein GCM10011410_12400 [Hoyosella rhizosphaerae]